MPPHSGDSIHSADGHLELCILKLRQRQELVRSLNSTKGLVNPYSRSSNQDKLVMFAMVTAFLIFFLSLINKIPELNLRYSRANHVYSKLYDILLIFRKCTVLVLSWLLCKLNSPCAKHIMDNFVYS